MICCLCVRCTYTFGRLFVCLFVCLCPYVLVSLLVCLFACVFVLSFCCSVVRTSAVCVAPTAPDMHDHINRLADYGLSPVAVVIVAVLAHLGALPVVESMPLYLPLHSTMRNSNTNIIRGAGSAENHDGFIGCVDHGTT